MNRKEGFVTKAPRDGHVRDGVFRVYQVWKDGKLDKVFAYKRLANEYLEHMKQYNPDHEWEVK